MKSLLVIFLAAICVRAQSSETNPVGHSLKDLPAGSGQLMAEAQRAFANGEYEVAEKKFSEILRQDEKNVFVLAHLANAQYGAGHTHECEATVQRALALDPDDAACLFVLGNLRFHQDKLDEALKALTRSASINPTNPATQNILGGVLCQTKQYDLAETALRKALQLDPNYGEAHHNLAIVYASQKPPFIELARWHYKKSLALRQPEDPALEKFFETN